jgi:hypothetical protein
MRRPARTPSIADGMANDPRLVNGRPELGQSRLRRGSFAKRESIIARFAAPATARSVVR